MERRRKTTTLLQLLNRRFSPAVFGRESAVAASLGMSDEELEDAERRGFSSEEASRVVSVIRELGIEIDLS